MSAEMKMKTDQLRKIIDDEKVEAPNKSSPVEASTCNNIETPNKADVVSSTVDNDDESENVSFESAVTYIMVIISFL